MEDAFLKHTFFFRKLKVLWRDLVKMMVQGALVQMSETTEHITVY